jgi:pantoate--beta-alanine ligase
MKIFKTIADTHFYIVNATKSNKTIGFVPTMGALHSGHISLIAMAQQQCDVVICSIFVNPTQFNNPADFEKYPITLDNDIAMLAAANCDALFAPNVLEMYPEGIAKQNLKVYDLNNLDTKLEGAFRPGHFQGVANIVHKLLKAVPCNYLYMGAKDYQQCMVVQQLIDVEKIKTQLIICPTLREANGLAKSSRNMRLSANAKQEAKVIFECLHFYKNNKTKLSFKACKQQCDMMLLKVGLEPEYTILANATTLTEMDNFDEKEKMVVLMAAYCEDVRLIDNMVIS